MDWIEAILNSDAARSAPEIAQKLIEAAGGVLSTDVSSPIDAGVTNPSAASPRAPSAPYPQNWDD